MDANLDLQAEMLAQKIKHYLIATNGRVLEEASDLEVYEAFCMAFREEIMINWLATVRTQKQQNCRMTYYLSMEYLPGRFLNNNISNAHSQDLVKAALNKLNHSYEDVRCLEHDPALGNGGLGRLASCFLDSLATLELPAMGYGLRYHYGTFEQQLWDGVQIEKPDCWLLTQNPWEFRRDQRRARIKFAGHPSENPSDVQEIRDFEEVRTLAFDIPIMGYKPGPDFSVVTLRLWSTKESPRNFELQRYNAGLLDQAAENTTLTDVLYPSDHHETGKRIRLKQEFLLVSSSLQDILQRHLARDPNPFHLADKVRIQINDTHPALVIAEWTRLLMKNGLNWQKAWEITQTCCSYTNHTIMKEALEEWKGDQLAYLLPRQYRIIERLNQQFTDDIRKQFPNDEERLRRMSIIQEGKVRMAHLAIYGSHKVNGVAALHTQILKDLVFKDFVDMYPDRFVNVTNGVTQRRWLLNCNPPLAKFIIDRIGDAWITDFEKIQELRNFASDEASQKEFLEIKQANKKRLLDFLTEDTLDRDQDGKPVDPRLGLRVDSLFDIQIKRAHEYKRQLLNALHLIMVYQEIKANPDHQRVPRTVIVGGKAAAGYEMAKKIIRLIHCIGRTIKEDPEVNPFLSVLYVENYNVSKAELLIPACELSQQISSAGMEASGTGNMKLSMNGALTIGTEDGANVEMKEEVGQDWWPFSFGSSSEELNHLRRTQTYNACEIYHNHAGIRQAVDALLDDTFARNEDEKESHRSIRSSLLESHYGAQADPFFVLKDLESYYQVQKKVEALYRDPLKWAEFAIHNMAGMGKFSTDVSIQHYAEEIWKLSPCPIDPEILGKVRHDYSEHDRCRILVD